jgi:acyl-CoA synthetase (AMP-forming)/AMP-acid ligase II
MPPAGEIHTPYGATESLPIASIRGKEILAETWPQTRQGKGTCVGRALPGIDIRIIRAVEGPITSWEDATLLPGGETGEIVVRGPVVTHAYDNNPDENLVAKIADGSGFWHRMGDMGYQDEKGRLWFCGRKAHRVMTAAGIMYTVPCEAIFNEHPEVKRTALVGVGKQGEQLPVLVVELAGGKKPADRIIDELRQLASGNVLTSSIATFLFHPSFPVDIRHNAKIFREKLAVWAEDQLQEHG